jgi:hypothetical protein
MPTRHLTAIGAAPVPWNLCTSDPTVDGAHELQRLASYSRVYIDEVLPRRWRGGQADPTRELLCAEPFLKKGKRFKRREL